MVYIKFVTVALALALLDSVAADGANFVTCIDWAPAQNPSVQTPFSISASLSPSGGYINCIRGGRGVISAQVPAGAAQGRYCSTDSVWADVDYTCGGGSYHGVFPVQLSGPSQWSAHRPGIAIDSSCPSPLGCDETASLFGDHANVVVCEDLNGGCDYAWQAGPWQTMWGTPTVAIVWQPNGSLSLESAEAGNPYNGTETTRDDL